MKKQNETKATKATKADSKSDVTLVSNEALLEPVTEIKERLLDDVAPVFSEASEREVIRTARLCRELSLAGLSASKIAEQINRSSSYTNKLITLSRATEPTLSLITSGKISAWIVAEALKTDKPEVLEEKINEAIKAATTETITDAALKIAVSKSIIAQMLPKQPRAKKQTPTEMITQALAEQKAKFVKMLLAGASVDDIEKC